MSFDATSAAPVLLPLPLGEGGGEGRPLDLKQPSHKKDQPLALTSQAQAATKSGAFSSAFRAFKRPAAALAWPLLGTAIALLLWWLGVQLWATRTPLALQFAPLAAGEAALELAQGSGWWTHAAYSLRRVGLGLVAALALGVPLGLLVGTWWPFARASSGVFQFLRMTSPLSWMPLAVMLLGVGDAPVVFLLAFAALWPIVLNVAAGVAAIDAQWLLLARSMGANRRELLTHILLPAVASHALTGVRLAIGIIWIVLVPAEMLGVNAGLGYFILDTRDRMAYGELMATVLLIGALGWALDALARAAHRRIAGG